MKQSQAKALTNIKIRPSHRKTASRSALPVELIDCCAASNYQTKGSWRKPQDIDLKIMTRYTTMHTMHSDGFAGIGSTPAVLPPPFIAELCCGAVLFFPVYGTLHLRTRRSAAIAR